MFVSCMKNLYEYNYLKQGQRTTQYYFQYFYKTDYHIFSLCTSIIDNKYFYRNFTMTLPNSSNCFSIYYSTLHSLNSALEFQ